MKPQQIKATIEVFAEDGRVKSRTTLDPIASLTKEQKLQLRDAVNKHLQTGRNIWARNHSGFMIKQQCLLG